MTHTEQDKQLTKAIYEAMQVPYLSERHDAIKKLIIADRKRVALEARLMELVLLRDDYDTSMDFEPIDKRIAELKAQQEEV